MANRNIKFQKPETPAFLQKFKDRVGYKEAPDITAKQRVPETSKDDEDVERDDEKPMVVVLREGDLTQEEAELHADKFKDALENTTVSPPDETDDKDDSTSSDTKITFKKPKKRKEDKAGLNVSSKKHDERAKKKKMESKTKGVKNTTLLSFGEDEEEED